MRMAIGSDERTHVTGAVAKEIVDAWLETGPDEAERATIAKVEGPHPALPQRAREN
jgi:hypothetical protein